MIFFIQCSDIKIGYYDVECNDTIVNVFQNKNVCVCVCVRACVRVCT